MNRLLLCFLLLLPVAIVHGQVTNVVFVGSVSVKGGDAFSYKIQVSDNNGVLTGYSVTDIMGVNETKTLIKGTINANQKVLKFRETKVVSTKSKAGSSLCFIQASLKASSKKGTTILKGSFKGYTVDGAECASGTMMLVSAKDVMDKLMKSDLKADTNITKNMMKMMAEDPVVEPEETIIYKTEAGVPESSIIKVAPGSTKELECTTKTAKIEFWDARTVDGDVITVTQNGKPILEKHTLTGTHKNLQIELLAHQETLEITAVDEGSEPLSTTRVKITMGNVVQYLDVSATVGRPARIVLKSK